MLLGAKLHLQLPLEARACERVPAAQSSTTRLQLVYNGKKDHWGGTVICLGEQKGCDQESAHLV